MNFYLSISPFSLCYLIRSLFPPPIWPVLIRKTGITLERHKHWFWLFFSCLHRNHQPKRMCSAQNKLYLKHQILVLIKFNKMHLFVVYIFSSSRKTNCKHAIIILSICNSRIEYWKSINNQHNATATSN